MTEPFVNLNDNIQYLYVSKNVTNEIQFSLFECIRNSLKIIIIFNRVKYLQFYIFIKILFIINI